MTARAKSPLVRRLDTLEAQYGKPSDPIPRNALEWIVWENVAYLVDDERRERAFRHLKKTVGITSAKLAGAAYEKVLAAATIGGIHPELRARRLIEIGELATEHDLGTLDQLAPKDAHRILKKFPSIGDPGAERILLACGLAPALALDSNGLRVLLRLGYGTEAKSYSTSYRSAQATASKELPEDCHARMRAHHLLRAHGQALCKRSMPDCDACPLSRDCRFARDAQN